MLTAAVLLLLAIGLAAGFVRYVWAREGLLAACMAGVVGLLFVYVVFIFLLLSPLTEHPLSWEL